MIFRSRFEDRKHIRSVLYQNRNASALSCVVAALKNSEGLFNKVIEGVPDEYTVNSGVTEIRGRIPLLF